MDAVKKQLNILMLEDNPADVRLIRETLRDVPGFQFNLEHASRVFDGLERLKTNSVDVILLDLGLPDSQGMETIKSFTAQVKKLPVIVLTGLDDEMTAISAVQNGAQDYLVKGQVEGITLKRSLRYAIERKRTQYQNEISLKILEILNKPGEQKEIIRNILSIVKDFSGCESVGLRLKQGKDYPYFESVGFEKHFPKDMDTVTCAENAYKDATVPGFCKILPDCMCSKVINGDYDPRDSCFTKNGSFWTCNRSDLLHAAASTGYNALERKSCIQKSCQSIALIPLKTHDQIIGLLHLCDIRKDVITQNQIEFFEGIANSIGIILDKKQSEDKLHKSYFTLKKTFNDAINTMVKIVEMRDPYTSGHQRRVARLTVAIAREMGMDQEFIDNLWMAALVHDIGKINVPSDILSKPGKLTEMEFKIVQTHCQGGYDIIKSMDFPCSVALSIIQHHERLDGSGYPMQLKGEDISLEARILAVADVIEAMSSHRPYRPSLGIEAALEEISINQEKLFDPAVVQTCVRLFKEKNFQFEKNKFHE